MNETQAMILVKAFFPNVFLDINTKEMVIHNLSLNSSRIIPYKCTIIKYDAKKSKYLIYAMKDCCWGNYYCEDLSEKEFVKTLRFIKNFEN